jgi:hypothetical protein
MEVKDAIPCENSMHWYAVLYMVSSLAYSIWTCIRYMAVHMVYDNVYDIRHWILYLTLYILYLAFYIVYFIKILTWDIMSKMINFN